MVAFYLSNGQMSEQLNNLTPTEQVNGKRCSTLLNIKRTHIDQVIGTIRLRIDG
jgi:hypothetical protein